MGGGKRGGEVSRGSEVVYGTGAKQMAELLFCKTSERCWNVDISRGFR